MTIHSEHAVPQASSPDTAVASASEAPAVSSILIRWAKLEDAEAIREMTCRAYPGIPQYSLGQIRRQIESFPYGQFSAVMNERIVGYSACFQVSKALAFAEHNWFEITRGGTAARHDPYGDWLYGMEVCVDPAARRAGIGRGLYDARKIICRRLGLDGIVIGGRLPGLARHWNACGSAKVYLEKVRAGELRDPSHSFHVANGFELVGILENFLPFDLESRGCAALMIWRNPDKSG